MSWEDAKAYCEWTGLKLPSEAQWEAAARGPEARQYPWGDEDPTAEHADFGKDFKKGKPDPVGSHPRGVGPYGTQDQAGGVWEWCEDVWDELHLLHYAGLTGALCLARNTREVS